MVHVLIEEGMPIDRNDLTENKVLQKATLVYGGQKVIKVRLLSVLEAIILRSNKQNYYFKGFQKNLTRLNIIIVAIGIVIPLIRAYYKSYGEYAYKFNVYFIIYLILASKCVFTYFGVNMLFLYTSLHDFLRRMHMAKAFSDLIDRKSLNNSNSKIKKSLYSDNKGDTSNNKVADVPLIDMTIPENINSWLLGRTIFQCFAPRVRSRLDAYLSAYLILVLLMMVVLAITIYSSSNAASLFFTAPPIQITLILLSVCALMSYIIQVATEVNDEYAKQK